MISPGNGSKIPGIAATDGETPGSERVWFIRFKKAKAVREGMAPFLNRLFMHSPMRGKYAARA